MNKFTLPVVFYSQIKGGYSAICPALKACFTEGDTFEETRKNIIELIDDNLEHMEEEDLKHIIEAYGMAGKMFTQIEIDLNEK